MISITLLSVIALSLLERTDMNQENSRLSKIGEFIQTYLVQGGAKILYDLSADALINCGIKKQQDPQGIHQAARTSEKSYQTLWDHIMELKVQAWLEQHLYSFLKNPILNIFKAIQAKKLIAQNIGVAIALTSFDPYRENTPGHIDYKCFFAMAAWMMCVLEPRVLQAVLGQVLTWSFRIPATIVNGLSHYAPTCCRPLWGCFNTAWDQVLVNCCKKKIISKMVTPSPFLESTPLLELNRPNGSHTNAALTFA